MAQSSDTALYSKKIKVEGKQIYLDFNANARGSYLRVSEVSETGVRHSVMLPTAALSELSEHIQECLRISETTELPETDNSNGGAARGGGSGSERTAPHGDAAAVLASRVYVSNLSWGTGDADLASHFGQLGEIVRASVFVEKTGRSRGCGIVEFRNDEDAATAIQILNNTELDGRVLWVRADREAAPVAGKSRK